MFSKRAPRTLFEYLIAQGGIVRGSRVCTFVISMSIALQTMERRGGERGGELTMEQFAEITGYSRAKAYRDQQAYRDLVPQFPNVVDLIDELERLRKTQRAASIQGIDVTALFA